MAVNVRSDLSGHAPTTKVGVIEKAYVLDPLEDGAVPVKVEGYLYAYDFADLVEDLQDEQDDLGFSYETTKTLVAERADLPDPTWEVTSLVFTGAAILYKKKAAYQSTSLAAEEDSMDNEKLKEALEAMGVDVSALGSVLGEWKTFKEALAAAGGYASLSVYLSAAAEEAKKVEELTAKVGELETALAAANEKLAKYEELEASVNEVKTKVDEAVAKVDETVAAVEPLVPHAETLKAEAQAREAWDRRSAMFPTTLAAKYAHTEEDDLAAEIAKIDARTDLTVQQSAALKAEAIDRHRRKQAS